MNRGRVFFTLILGVAVVAAFTLAYAATKMPEQDLVIETKDVFKEKKKGPVTFSHTNHKALKCTDCHHEYKDGQNVWQEGQEVKKCGQCHKLEAEGKVAKLYDAYHSAKSEHSSCVGCHTKMKKEGKKKAPTACTKCHPKKAGEAEDKEEGEKK